MSQFDKTLGTLLVGILFNTYLYGLVSYQFAAYVHRGFKDPPAVKCMVHFLFFLDTFHSISAIYMAWNYTVTNYDNPSALSVADWPYTFTPIGTAAAALVTQVFLGYRIWRLSESATLYAMVIVMAFPSFVLGVACGIRAWIIKVLSDLPRINNLVIAWLAMQVMVDTFITVTLTIVLIRSKTGYRKTDSVVNRLVRGAIQTGLFAGIFSLGDLVSFLVLPNTNLYGMFAIPIGRIYTNTLLDTLLTRDELKSQLVGTYWQSSGIEWAQRKSALTQTQTQVHTQPQRSQRTTVVSTLQSEVHRSSINVDAGALQSVDDTSLAGEVEMKGFAF